jgi:hypothetical protein
VSVPVVARGRSLHVVDRRRVSTLLSTRLFDPAGQGRHERIMGTDLLTVRVDLERDSGD